MSIWFCYYNCRVVWYDRARVWYCKGVQDNSAQNQLGPCQLGPHKNRPMPTRPKMQNSAHTNSAQFKFYKRLLVQHFRGIEVCVFHHLLVQHFRGIEVCVFHHLLTARFAPRIKYPYPFVHIEFYHGYQRRHKRQVTNCHIS